FDLGDYHDNFGLQNIAEQLYERAIKVNEQSIDLRLQFAARLARHKKYKEALKYIADVLDLDPQNSMAIKMGQKIVKELENQNILVQSESK
ncbi:MAG: hypothetical protein ABIJ45_08125, partial [Candidatus Zixiibacteriota bacterium]